MREIPEGFAAEARRELGPEAAPLLDALRHGDPRPSVRLNPAKPADEIPSGETVAWHDGGRYVERGEGFTLDPLFHAGAYYVQDASSMFVGRAVSAVVPIDRSVVLIDACAAPGGKTTAAIDALPAGSLVIANEIVPARCAVLKENIIKWGYPATIVTRGDTAALARLGEVADVVIADVPCSGEGMMRKDRVAAEQWSEGLVESCSERQKEIVANLWHTLRPGGVMIYSTCTFNRRENEEMVRFIVETLAAEPMAVPTDEGWGIAPGIDTPYPCYRFMPHRLQGEGLFVAVLRKTGDLDTPRRVAAAPKERRKEKGVAVPPAIKEWIDNAGEMEIAVTDDRVNAFPRQWDDLRKRAESVTTVVHHGIPLATAKGRDYIPAHGLAMSTAMNPKAFPHVEVGREAALDYLRREAVTLPEGTPRGFVVLTYGGLPLGFAKNLGNRANNLYPQEYKIRYK